MTSRYTTSPSNLRALRDRLTNVAKAERVVFGRLQQHVGVLVLTEFMSALTDEHGMPQVLVKGGVSLELRRGIPESRTSKDLDTVVRGDVNEVFNRLADVAAAGWSGFTADLTEPEAFEVTALGAPVHRFTAKLKYHGKSFVSVPVEVSPVEAGNAATYDSLSSSALTLVGLPNSQAVACMTLPWQIAQKIHACTEQVEPPRSNDRAHDLVDLQLLDALLVDQPLDTTRAACIAVFAARGAHAWAPTLVAQPHWEPIYTRALEELNDLGLATNVDDAVDWTNDFIRRIDAAST